MKKLLTALAVAVAMIFAAPSAALAKKSKEKPAEKTEEKSDKLDLNTASKAQLMELDGVGEVYSDKIIKCREEKPLKAKDELKERCGVPDATYDKMIDKVIAKHVKPAKKKK